MADSLRKGTITTPTLDPNMQQVRIMRGGWFLRSTPAGFSAVEREVTNNNRNKNVILQEIFNMVPRKIKG